MAKTAFINLSTGDVKIAQSEQAVLEKYIGGRGYASKLLFDHVGPDVEPLAPENMIIFSIGSFGGTAWPTSGRGHVTYKSPVTGAYGHANSGGDFGGELGKAGYDAFAITGKAASPVYLYVTDDSVEIRPADDLWGLEVSPLSDKLEVHGKVTCIGPAGENQVYIAAIINDRNRAAARGGGGAVMGSKLLKAVVVKAAGKRGVPPDYKKKAIAAAKAINSNKGLDGLRRYGTSLLVDIQNMAGSMPSRNHQRVQVPFISKVCAEALDKYVLKSKGCYACPIKCGRVSQVKDGPYACDTGGPEYETINALGPTTWVSNMEAIIYTNLRCNELGLDTISAGVTIGFAMECHENGLISDPELSLEWGDAESVIGLLEKIAHREGIGDILAYGSRGAARRIGKGAERFAMQIKGLELPRQDPRVAKGFALAHATSNRGADHLYGLPTIDSAGMWDVARRYFPAEMVDELMESLSETYKPDLLVFEEHYSAVTDALGICKFTTTENYATLPEVVAEGLSALWGREVTFDELLEYGERIVNLERLYNVRSGLGRADDRPPERFMTEPVDIWQYTQDPETGEDVQSEKPVRSGVVIEDFDAMLDRYYMLRGWDQNGAPVQETLDRLKIS